MKTRATKKAPTKATDAQATETVDNPKTLAPTTSNPPLLFVLPDNTSSDARIVTLPNPATSNPARYYFCPEKGIYEFTKIAAPKQSPRSWLLAPPRNEGQINGLDKPKEDAVQNKEESHSSPTAIDQGYAIQDAHLFLATPLDSLFVLLPALIPKAEETNQLFLSIEDHLDVLAENEKHLKHLIRSDKLRTTFEQRANVICDNVDMGHEKMYRLSNQKLLAELLRKAEKMTRNGLPASMESHFVKDALSVPVMLVQREESSASFATSQPEADQTPTPAEESQLSAAPSLPSFQTQDSNLSTLTEATSFSTTTITTTEPPAPIYSAPEEIVNLLRLRTALHFILSSYIPPPLRSTLLALLSTSKSPIDFTPLETHLDQIAALKREQHALRSLSDNISRKRTGVNDDEAEEARAEKKRKKDDEDKAKKNVSRGVKQLAKVNTAGMKKMSSFFTKAAPKKKA